MSQAAIRRRRHEDNPKPNMPEILKTVSGKVQLHSFIQRCLKLGRKIEVTPRVPYVLVQSRQSLCEWTWKSRADRRHLVIFTRPSV